jgi:endonuclease III
LKETIRKLRAHYGAPVAVGPEDPYRLLLFEEIGYLCDDATRLAAYRFLESSVGTKPADILRASVAKLRTACRKGGAIAVNVRAERLQTIAARVFETWAGKPRFVANLSVADARKELAKFPGVGLAGADRTMILAGTHAVMALDSNGLRVLQRLGFAPQTGNWNRDYEAGRLRTAKELPNRIPSLRAAFLLLRSHGKALCKRSAPRCNRCPLVAECPTGKLMR